MDFFSWLLFMKEVISSQFLEWRMFAIYVIVFLYLIRLLNKDVYVKLYYDIPFDFRFVSLAVIGLALFFYRLVMIASPYVGVPYSVQIMMVLRETHLRSFIFYAVLIFYLWRKFGSLLPSVFAGWFGIAMIEFSYIAQHYILWGAFMGLQWYLPFFIISLPFFFDWNKYRLSRKILIFFAIGVFLQYFTFIWDSDAFVLWQNGVITNNWRVFYNPTLQTWLHELFDNMKKSIMTIGFCYIDYRGTIFNRKVK